MFKTVIKKAKLWHFLRLPRGSETDHPKCPVPSFEPPSIVVSNPQGQHVDNLDANYKETHPFHQFRKRELEQTPLTDLFPDLFYKTK